MKIEMAQWYKMFKVQIGDILVCKGCWHQWVADKDEWIKRCPNCRKPIYNKWERRIINFTRNFNAYVSSISYSYRKKNNIKSLACFFCGFISNKMAAHHENYLKPFDIIWMCFPCHVKYHKKIGVIQK
jgi:hypothetical protein